MARSSARVTSISPAFRRASRLVALAWLLGSVGGALGCRAGGAPAAESAPTTGLARVAWLVGTWRATSPDGTFEETWDEPSSGAMRGRGRLVRDGRERFFEDLRLEARGESLVYVASPNGRGATEFASTTVEDGHVRFENPTHDDPKVIDYRLLPDGVLEVRLSGAVERTFGFRRAP